MTPTREYCEKIAQFEPWLKEARDWSVPLAERGLKEDAPEEVKAVYAWYLADKADRRKRGLR